ncbi:FAD-dependent oxidoreductase [Draconibacterium sp. IB214405]|uniref:NAD(P)/FAD-dependent oxidoreductase n=1 Tax=Draconibacterium sp. IB214405 TaxID=3097352 RepID=UPI002A0D8C18|nr:FAD-dependent oxidoreductase [Draconibacterium sp. IB214405]MDX8340045.1 FAD-dependent oxidoreductase [Draconibacterium sp. IB214405]
MKRKEVLIVGQGLAGTLLAFELYFAGVDVCIVNNPQKSTATRVAAGMVNPLVFKRMTKSWMVDELLPVMKKRYRQLEELLGEQFYFDLPMLKPLSEQETELWQQRKTDEKFAPFIDDIRENSPVNRVFKSHAYGIVKGSGYLKTGLFLDAAKRFFEQNEMLIEADFPSNQSNFEDHIFQNIQFDKLVFCEGHYLKTHPLFEFVRLQPAKGEVLQIYAPDLSEKYIINRRVFVLPIGDHRFKVGSTYEWKDLTDTPTEEGKFSIIERLKDLIHVDFKVEEHWAGVRPTVVDRRPVLGKHPAHEHMYLFNGLGTKGVMLAPFFATEMKNLILNGNYSVSKEVDLARFI